MQAGPAGGSDYRLWLQELRSTKLICRVWSGVTHACTHAHAHTHTHRGIEHLCKIELEMKFCFAEFGAVLHTHTHTHWHTHTQTHTHTHSHTHTHTHTHTYTHTHTHTHTQRHWAYMQNSTGDEILFCTVFFHFYFFQPVWPQKTQRGTFACVIILLWLCVFLTILTIIAHWYNHCSWCSYSLCLSCFWCVYCQILCLCHFSPGYEIMYACGKYFNSKGMSRSTNFCLVQRESLCVCVCIHVCVCEEEGTKG